VALSRRCSIAPFFAVLYPGGLLAAAQSARVDPQTKIEGMVVTRAGNAPVLGADVVLRRNGDSGPPLLVSTDANGHFVAEELAPGDYTVTASKTGYITGVYGARNKSRKPAVISLRPGEKIDGINLRLTATGVIAGHVLGEEGTPRIGAQVSAFLFRYVDGERRLVGAGQANANDLGEYRIYGIAPGRYFLVASQQDSSRYVRRPKGVVEERYVATFYPNADDLTGAVKVEVDEGAATTGINIIMARRKAFHIRGRVAGACRGVRVQLWPKFAFDTSYRGPRNDPDAQGDFDLGGISSGAYILAIIGSSGGQYCSATRQIDVGTADVEGIILTPSPAMDLAGHVSVEEGSEGIQAEFQKLGIVLHPANAAALSMPEPAARPVRDGTFSLWIVDRNPYRVQVTGFTEDFYLKSVHIGVEEAHANIIDLTGVEKPAGSLEILISPNGGRIDGIVKSDQGSPAGGALVALVPGSDRRREDSLFKETTAGSDGEFTFRGIAPGAYKLFAWDDIESRAYEDPDFLRDYEDKGASVTIEAGERKTVEIPVIPSSTSDQ
jgi:hypothetical protein